MENCKDIVDMVMSKHVSKAGRMDSGLDEAMLRDDKAADVLRRSRGMLEMVTLDLGCVFLGYPMALMMTALHACAAWVLFRFFATMPTSKRGPRWSTSASLPLAGTLRSCRACVHRYA